MLQGNVMQLCKLLLTGYQFSSVMIPIEYVVVLRQWFPTGEEFREFRGRNFYFVIKLSIHCKCCIF